ncbi:MAG: DUF881 domain-containing protein [Ruminococcaceae bacterium]|nr:DUF881 domain-containing protein [Oscillospiraceae bacterium]
MEANKKNTNKKSMLIVMLVFTLLGIVFALQFRSVAHTQKTQNEKTSAEILQYQKTIEELEKKINDNKETKEALETRYDSEMDYLYNNEKQFYELYKKYETDIAQYRFNAGLTTVSGSGIDIGLDDAPTRYELTPGLLVHDIYLNEIINTLRLAGAQAISVNGERIVSMSETLCVGPSIRINNTKLFAPYHIQAIGDPQELMAAFKTSSIYSIMIKENLIVDPVIKDNITIKKYSKSYLSSIDKLSDIGE